MALLDVVRPIVVTRRRKVKLFGMRTDHQTGTLSGIYVASIEYVRQRRVNTDTTPRLAPSISFFKPHLEPCFNCQADRHDTCSITSRVSLVASHEHGTEVAGLLPGSWDHLDCQSWDHPACLAGGSGDASLDLCVGVVGVEVHGRTSA